MSDTKRQVSTFQEATEAVKEGWTLVGFILERANELDWNKIQWHTKEGNSGFSWAYTKDPSGSEYPELRPYIEAVKAGSIKEGNLEYSLSKNGMFLQRITHNE